MSNKQTYKVLKPVNLDGFGTVQVGDTVALHPRQAVFLVAGGVLEVVNSAKGKPERKETKT